LDPFVGFGQVIRLHFVTRDAKPAAGRFIAILGGKSFFEEVNEK
jgi:hypothetical protein